jgi:sulfate/thiosulfate transport system substrate-binding protein
MPRIRIATGVAVVSLAAATAAGAASTGTNLNLVAYSTPKPVLSKIISDFQATPQGRDASFSQSYGASTSQARAVIAGQPADLVFLSAGDDVNQLVDAGLVSSS